MVPFSFENIARSAGLDAPKAHPVSDAARATHESFTSHLQSAIAPPRDQSTRPPAHEDKPRERSGLASGDAARNEPIRQDTRETSRDETDVHQTDTEEAKAAEKHSDDDDQRDAKPEDEAVVASVAEPPPAPSQAVELDASGDADAISHSVVEVGGASRGDEESTLDASSVHGGEESGDDAAADGKSERVSGEADAGTRGVKSSDTNEELATGQFDEASHVADKTSPDDEPAQASTKQRPRGNRGDVAVDQATNEATDAATKLAAPDIVEAAVESAGEESSRQRHSRPDKDGPQPIGSANAADAPTTTAGTPSRFAQHLLGKAENTSGRGVSISDADQARFVDRVARAVQATGDRGGTLRLRLSPPELGALTLEVKVQGGVVTARVEADTPAARSLLLENLPLLRERLAEHGMRVDQFDVDLSDRHPGGTPDGLQQNNQQHEDRPRAKAAALKHDDTAPVISSEAPTKNGTEQLNVIV